MKLTNTTIEGIKFLLVGGFATIIDLGLFDLIIWIIASNPLIAKSISFLVSVAIKYMGNKYWTFGQHNNEKVKKEILQFGLITVVALIIDLTTFYCATKVLGPQFGLSVHLWTQASVILAALSSAVVSFLGYKFLVFKK